MDKQMRSYEKQLIKEIEGSKTFSFKQFLSIVKLNSLCKMMNK